MDIYGVAYPGSHENIPMHMNYEWCGFAYMNMNKDTQLEFQKPVTNSSKLGKWAKSRYE
jgi:hypothetical protein